jgi:hypothetical protein
MLIEELRAPTSDKYWGVIFKGHFQFVDKLFTIRVGGTWWWAVVHQNNRIGIVRGLSGILTISSHKVEYPLHILLDPISKQLNMTNETIPLHGWG